MLTAVPKSFFGWDYRVFDGGEAVAELSLAWMRERGTLHVSGSEYQVDRQGLLSGAWILSEDGLPLVEATKPSALARIFEVRVGERLFELKARSAFGRAFDLLEDGRAIGRFDPEGWLSRRMRIDLPASLSLAVQVFLTWLVVVLWKRAANA